MAPEGRATSESLDAEPVAEGFGDLFQVASEGDERVLLDGPVAVRRQVVVEELPGGDRLRPGGNDHGSLSASGDEILQRHAVRDGEPPAFDQVERLVHLGALGQACAPSDVPDREVVPLALEAERAVSAVAFFADPGHVASPSCGNALDAALLAENWRKTKLDSARGRERFRS